MAEQDTDMSKKKKVVVRKGVPKKRKYKGSVRSFTLGSGLPAPEIIREELRGYRAVLLGHEDPPIEMGIITLMEVAEGYFSRACDIEQQILEAVSEGRLVDKTVYHSLRTQEIRSFKEMAKSATELGSRRITWENLRYQQEMRGLESL
jgi:hypothetical protein